MWKVFNFLGRLSLLNWILIGLVVFLTIKGCYEKYEFKKTASIQAPTIPAKTDVIADAEEIARAVDTAGREKVVFKLSDPIIQKIEDNAKVDSLAKENDIKTKQITAITQIAGSLEKQNTDLKRMISTLENGDKDTIFYYSDKWLSAEGFRKNDTTFTLRNIASNVSINKIDYDHKKYWGFGRNESRSIVYFDNPYISVGGLKALTVKQKEPYFDISITPRADLYFDGKSSHNLFIMPANGAVRLGRLYIDGGLGFSINNGSVMNKGFTYKVGLGYKLY